MAKIILGDPGVRAASLPRPIVEDGIKISAKSEELVRARLGTIADVPAARVVAIEDLGVELGSQAVGSFAHR